MAAHTPPVELRFCYTYGDPSYFAAPAGSKCNKCMDCEEKPRCITGGVYVDGMAYCLNKDCLKDTVFENISAPISADYDEVLSEWVSKPTENCLARLYYNTMRRWNFSKTEHPPRLHLPCDKQVEYGLEKVRPLPLSDLLTKDLQSLVSKYQPWPIPKPHPTLGYGMHHYAFREVYCSEECANACLVAERGYVKTKRVISPQERLVGKRKDIVPSEIVPPEIDTQ